MRRIRRLHERTRRRIGLGGFALLCLLPTAVMLSWGVSRQLPSEKTVMAQRLSELFGFRVTIRSVEHPEPGRVRLRGLVFHRPELEPDADLKFSRTPPQVVARLATLEIRRQTLNAPYGKLSDTIGEKLRDTICLTGAGLEIHRDELSEIVRIFRELVDYRLSDVTSNVQLALDRVRFLDDSNEVPDEVSDKKKTLEPELSEIQFRLFALKDGPLALMNFRLVDMKTGTTSRPIYFRTGQQLAAKRADRLDANFWFDLDTQAEPVPCRLLGSMITLFESFGPDATFSGYFCAGPSPDGWVGTIAKQKTADSPGVPATIANVDLDRLIGRRFSQVFTGRADIMIENASFQASRIERIQGQVISTKPGMIGRPLLTTAAKELGMQLNPLNTTAAEVPYKEFKARFTIDQRGVFIEGGYPGNVGQRPILLDRNQRELVWESGRVADVAAFLRTLVPNATAHIPAVRSIERLAQRLPVQ